MTKTTDAAHESGDLNEKTDPRSPKKVDLHRYQVMTIPMELQQELASLKGPRLSDEEMKPLPPIEEVVKARLGTSSNPSALRATALQLVTKHRIVLLGTALVLALGLLLWHRSSQEPLTPASPVGSVNANELPNTPISHQELAQQPSSLPAPLPAVPAAAQGASKREPSQAKTAAPSPSYKPAHAQSPGMVASSIKPTTVDSPPVESTKKPPRSVHFKPE